MAREIRKGALRQIQEKTAPRAWHPDSLTEITQSTRHELNQDYADKQNASVNVSEQDGGGED